MVAPLAFAALVAFEAVAPLAAAARTLPAVRAAGARVLDVAGRTPIVRDPARPRPAPRRRPALDLRGVRLRRGRDRQPVLDGVDLHVGPGERVVVTGPSGAGKSTLLALLVRFLERDGGQAALDGHDLRDHAQHDVRAEVLLLAQDPHVFDSDVRENVAFARPGATDEEVVEALRRARLGDWLASLDDGLPDAGGRGRPGPVGRPAPAAGRWPGPSSPTRRCCCSTSRPPTSTPAPPPRCSTTCGPPPGTGRWSW